MIVHSVSQNSDSWDALRRGRPTASAMSEIVCPEMGSKYVCSECGKEFDHARKRCDECKAEVLAVPVVKMSAQAEGYAFKLIYESMFNLTIPGPVNADLDRGHELEPKCLFRWQTVKDMDTQKVGFVTTDDAMVGASPDLFAGEDGMVEGKCPRPWVHLQYMANPGTLTRKYFVQLQSQLMVCGTPDLKNGYAARRWVDIVSYSELPDGTPLPCVIEHVEPDEEYISGMRERLVEFLVKLNKTHAELLNRFGDFRPKPEQIADAVGVSLSDVEALAQ